MKHGGGGRARTEGIRWITVEIVSGLMGLCDSFDRFIIGGPKNETYRRNNGVALLVRGRLVRRQWLRWFVVVGIFSCTCRNKKLRS